MRISHAGSLLAGLCAMSSGPRAIADDSHGKLTTVAVAGGSPLSPGPTRRGRPPPLRLTRRPEVLEIHRQRPDLLRDDLGGEWGPATGGPGVFQLEGSMDLRRDVLAVLGHFAGPHLAADATATFAEMGEHLRYMRSRWIDRSPVDYGPELRRLAFLCSHVPVNADSLAWIMEGKCYTLTRFMHRKLNESGVLRVWALGGGPGTEMFSLLHQLQRSEAGINEVAAGAELPRIEFTACDREARWEPIFERMRHQLAIAYAEPPGPRRFRFHTRPELLLPPAGLLPDGAPPDLYLINYVLSENGDELQEALSPVVEAAGADALFLLTDVLRPVGSPVPEGRAFLEGLGLHIRWPRPHPGAFDPCYEYKMHMNSNVEIMAPFYQGIKDNYQGWELRRNSDVFWLVASKHDTHPDFEEDW